VRELLAGQQLVEISCIARTCRATSWSRTSCTSGTWPSCAPPGPGAARRNRRIIEALDPEERLVVWYEVRDASGRLSVSDEVRQD
jgi:hypothetical protein